MPANLRSFAGSVRPFTGGADDNPATPFFGQRPLATMSEMDEFEFFLEKPWSDGLPVVTPTEERVQRMLAGMPGDPDALIGSIPPAMEPATLRTVAIHALMAGCKPEYLPVVVGGLRLMLREEFNLNGVQGTMHGVAPLMIVNGPYAQRIGLHGSNGCFGPGFRANASIGRAIRLMLLNLGGGIPGVGSATVFGTPLRYSACLTENKARSPWETLAVSRGYRDEDDVISCAMVESPRLCYDDASQEPERLLTGLADSMTALSSWNMHVRSDMVVAMSPEQASLCARAGLGRSEVHRMLIEQAGRRVQELKRGGNWRPERARKLGIDPAEDHRFVPAIKNPRDLHLIVAGGWGPLSAVCHGWGGGSRAVHGTYQTRFG
jgi:hypothetical protein